MRALTGLLAFGMLAAGCAHGPQTGTAQTRYQNSLNENRIVSRQYIEDANGGSVVVRYALGQEVMVLDFNKDGVADNWVIGCDAQPAGLIDFALSFNREDAQEILDEELARQRRE